jgi:hypothetical protein
MLRVSWDCRISACTSSRKKKETDRASCDAQLRLARIRPRSHTLATIPLEMHGDAGTAGGDPWPISGARPSDRWAQRRHTTRRAAQHGRNAVASSCRGFPQFASPPRCASRRWRRLGPARSARCRAAHPGLARLSMALAASACAPPPWARRNSTDLAPSPRGTAGGSSRREKIICKLAVRADRCQTAVELVPQLAFVRGQHPLRPLFHTRRTRAPVL